MSPRRRPCPYACPYGKGRHLRRSRYIFGSFGTKLRGALRICLCARRAERSPTGWSRVSATSSEYALRYGAVEGGQVVAGVWRLAETVTDRAQAGRPRPHTYAKRKHSTPNDTNSFCGRHHLVDHRSPRAYGLQWDSDTRHALQRHPIASPDCRACALASEDSTGAPSNRRVCAGRQGNVELFVEVLARDPRKTEGSPARTLSEKISTRRLTTNASDALPGGRGAPGSVDRQCALLWLGRSRAASAPPCSPLSPPTVEVSPASRGAATPRMDSPTPIGPGQMGSANFCTNRGTARKHFRRRSSSGYQPRISRGAKA